MKKHSGIYTGKYSVGQRVHSSPGVYKQTFFGTIRSVLDREEMCPYGVEFDDIGDPHDDGSPVILYFSEEEIVEG